MNLNQLSLFEQTILEATATSGTTKGCYKHFAEKLNISDNEMQHKVHRGVSLVKKWNHKIRLIQQRLKEKGLIEKAENKGAWRVTGKGREKLTFAPHGGLKPYFETKNGIAFWGDSQLIPSLFPAQIDLIVTSPPYLLGKERSYGNIGMDEDIYVSNLLTAIESWLPCLTRSGSIVLNLGESIKPGEGYQNLHREKLLIALHDKLGLKLIQKFQWYSPTKIPSGHWTTKKRRDCVNVLEDFFWLSLNPKECKANNKNVLVEYSETQKKYMQSAIRKSGVRKKPSGQSANDESFYGKDHGGAIPSNLLMATPESASSAYSLYCKNNGLPRHNAMFNHLLPEFFIRYLTESGDCVFDPYFGSGNTGYAAEENDRHWIGGEIAKEHLDGAISRFKNPVMT